MNILTEEVAIEGKNIIKDFQLSDTKTRVLKNISLKVIQGEFVSIMGQSGSGKSTLLYILGGLDVPTSGSVFMNGMDISKFNDEKNEPDKAAEYRICFSVLQPYPQLECGRKYHASAFVGRKENAGLQKTSERYFRGSRLIGQTRAYTPRIVRGTTATCGNRPRTNWKSRNPVCRRTYGKP